METFEDTVRKEVRLFMARKKMRQHVLAEQLKLSRITINRFLGGHTMLSGRNLSLVLDYIGGRVVIDPNLAEGMKK